MGICTRLTAALIALFLFPLSALATERVRVDPYIKAGPGYTAANGSITGYVPTKSNQDLLLEAERKGWLGKDSSKTPVTVKPKVKVPVSGIGGKLKNLVKTNPAQLALHAATAAAISGVGWVMEEGSQPGTVEVKKPGATKVMYGATDLGFMAQNADLPSTSGSSSIGQCSYGKPGVGMFKGGGQLWRIVNVTAGQVPSASAPFANYTNCDTWWWQRASLSSVTFVAGTPIKVTDSDMTSTLDPYIGAQGATWLKDLLRDVCSASNNPQGCLDDLQKQSPPSISGPSSVTGPSLTTTGTYTRPDGTTGTTSSTTNTRFDLTYGDQHYDYTTTTTTTNTKDGQQTSQETTTDAGVLQETPSEEDPSEEQYTFDDSALPEITPFYEQKYPDGLQGVWNDAKADFENSEFVSFMESFVPSFSGTCPSWSMNFAIGALANFGTIPFQSLCYVFDFIKVIILVTAVFTCRAIVFGG